ncbi:hypothetical protein DPSP01_005933 [Paraphaeosphaeria sporulosa]
MMLREEKSLDGKSGSGHVLEERDHDDLDYSMSITILANRLLMVSLRLRILRLYKRKSNSANGAHITRSATRAMIASSDKGMFADALFNTDCYEDESDCLGWKQRLVIKVSDRGAWFADGLRVEDTYGNWWAQASVNL